MDVTNWNDRPTNYSEPTDKVKAVWAAILQQWPHTRIDTQDPTRVWSQAIDGLPTEAIRYAIGLFKNDTSEWAPTPGQFRSLAKGYQVLSEPPKRVPRDAKENAWRATAVWYSYLVNQHMGQIDYENEPRGLHQGTHWAGGLARSQPPRIAYHGDFDYRSVAAGTRLPDNRRVESMAEAKKLHAPCWRALRENFEAAWRGETRH